MLSLSTEQLNINVNDDPIPKGELLEPSCYRPLPLAVRGRGPQREDGGRVDAAPLRRQVERLRVRRDPAGSGTVPPLSSADISILITLFLRNCHIELVHNIYCIILMKIDGVDKSCQDPWVLPFQKSWVLRHPYK